MALEDHRAVKARALDRLPVDDHCAFARLVEAGKDLCIDHYDRHVRRAVLAVGALGVGLELLTASARAADVVHEGAPAGTAWLATLLVLLISPVLYFFLFQPMVTHISKHQKFEEALDAAAPRMAAE